MVVPVEMSDGSLAVAGGEGERRDWMLGLVVSRSGIASVLVASLAASLALASSASASVYTVTSSADSGLGSFRQAIINVDADSSPDVVDFSGALGTITLASDLPVIDNSVTINANGATLSGAGGHRGLLVFSGTVAINDLTIANAVAHGGNTGVDGGGGGLGGGLFVASGATVALSDVTFSTDAATGGFPQAIIPALRAAAAGSAATGSAEEVAAAALEGALPAAIQRPTPPHS